MLIFLMQQKRRILTNKKDKFTKLLELCGFSRHSKKSDLFHGYLRWILTIKSTVNFLKTIISLIQLHHWLVYSSAKRNHNEKDN